MAVVDNGKQILIDRAIGQGSKASFVVDSIGYGTDGTPNESETSSSVDRIGANGGDAYFKTGADVTITTGTEDGSPFFQFEAEFGNDEISEQPTDVIVLKEIGISSGSLDGTNPAANDGTRLFTRRTIGGSVGIGKTQEFSVIARSRVNF